MMQHHHSKPYNVTRRRTHLKPSQVAVLQESFVENSLPDASMRAQLSQELGVTERTVQIWFQNRRAKARKMEANGETPTLVPNVRTGWIDVPKMIQKQPTATTFRSYITPECYDSKPDIKRRPRSSSKPEKVSSTAFLVPTPPQRAMSEGMGRIPSTETKDDQYLVSFPLNTIRIGSWARFASQVNNEWDLVCFSDPVQRQFIWQVHDNGHQFRIEVGFNQIRQIRLGQISTNTDLGQLEIDVQAPMLFSMRRQGIDQDWIRCGDFTENQQATEGRSHSLQGSHDQLKQSLLELISQAPELASKLVILPDNDILCRELTVSPSATPEPMAHYYNSNDFMMEKNPWNNSYYQPYDGPAQNNTTTNWTYLNMLGQQQQQQQQPLLTTPLNLFM